MTGAFPQRPYGSADFEPKRRKLPLYLDKRRCLIGVDDIDADRDSSHPDRQATDVQLPARSLPGDVRVPSINPHTCGRLVHETSFRRLATSFGVPGWRQRPSELQPRLIDDDMAIPGIRGGTPHLHRPVRAKLRARPWRWLRRHRPGAAPHSSTLVYATAPRSASDSSTRTVSKRPTGGDRGRPQLDCRNRADERCSC